MLLKLEINPFTFMTEIKQITLRGFIFMVLAPRVKSQADETPRQECLLAIVNTMPQPDAKGEGLNDMLRSKVIAVPGADPADYGQKFPKGTPVVIVAEYKERDGMLPAVIAHEVMPDDGRQALTDLKNWYGEGEWEKVMATSS